MKTYIKLGCGARFHPEWTNIDMVSRGPGVIEHDLSKGIPLSDNSVDVVYHSAVLEHLRKPAALFFMQEGYRVLKPGGIIRVGVPDLEQICRIYLATLESALSGKPGAAADHEWMMIEILDQVAREYGGGEMLEYLALDPIPNETFVYQRIGQEGREIVELLRKNRAHAARDPGFVRRLWRFSLSIRRNFRAFILSLFLGPNAALALSIGRYRLGGEAHRWMYDRFSLDHLMKVAGFIDPTIRSPFESAIPEWSRFNLDTKPDGSVNKPDLFFMEARKPQLP